MKSVCVFAPWVIAIIGAGGSANECVVGNFRVTYGSDVVDGKQATKSDTER